MNLLTTEQKEITKQIYRKKFLIVFLWMLSVVGVIFLLAIAPLYIQLSQQSFLLEQKISDIQSSELAIIQENRDEVISYTNNLLDLFEQEIESPKQYLQKIVQEFDGVEIDQIIISYENGSIEFSGQAATRQDFVVMTNTLQEAQWAHGVEVPVSNFTKSEDIPFSLSLQLNTEVYDD